MINLIQSEIKNELGYNDQNIKQSNSNSGSWIKDGENDEIAVLLSGGVDSSVALKLLQEQGHKVRAFYLKIWLEDEVAHLNQCPWEEDLQYAQSVCEQLNVPLETLSLQKEYWNEVVQYTIKEAENGFTPNQDIMCYCRIKFGMFYEYVGKYFPKVATGHYAQVKIDKDTGKARLIMSPDAIKDQTYFLSNLRQDQLAKALFPIGHLQKSEVRELAQRYNLPTQVRKDSQGICFLGKLKFDDFIAHYLGESHGPIVDYKTGKLLGKHKGLWFHTIGQRKGIGLLLGPGSVHLGPWIVAAKDAITNTLYATNDLDVVERPRLEFKVEKINWVSGDLPLNLNIDGDDIEIKLRHGPNFNKGRIYIDKSYSSASVKLTDRDKGIAPGQFAAFYRNKECLGAGIIASTIRDDYDTKENVQLTNEEITFIEP
jgi:tRNA-specific 2-thiouridylase